MSIEITRQFCEGVEQVDIRPSGTTKEAKETKVNIICGSDFDPEPIVWVWNDWLAAGKFHILAGAPGTGKTTIALSLAATVTRGDEWPDGTTCQPGNILIWSGEDDRKNTLLPRLLAHGADAKRTYFIENIEENSKPRLFDPSRDIGQLCEAVSKIGDVRFIIVDPVVNVVAGDSHKNGEVRRALQPLVELAEKLQAVVLGISHFSKGTMGYDPLERVTGSVAFGALARVVLATAKTTDPNGEVRHLLVRAKSNHGPDGDGYAYHMDQVELPDYPGIFSPRAVWGDPVSGSARELINDTDSHETTDERSMFSEAIDFLKTVLAEGAVSKKEVIIKAKEVGLKEVTLRRAKTFLRIEAIHEGYGKGSLWKWVLPVNELHIAKDSDIKNSTKIFQNHENGLLDLKRCHPPIVEGCELSEILLHADPYDYEFLKDPGVLACFARSLKDAGTIKVLSSNC